MLYRIAMLAAVLWLAACAGPAVVGPSHRSAATWSDMVYAASHGPVLVRVTGDPFRLGGEQFAAAVAAGMSGQLPGYPVRFTSDQALAPQPTRRVELTFTSTPEGRIEVNAAFRDRDEALSEARGWVEGASGPEDPRFATLLGDLTRELFGSAPRHDSSDRPGWGWSF